MNPFHVLPLTRLWRASMSDSEECIHLAENLAIVLQSFHNNTWNNQSLFLPLQWEMPSYEGHFWPGYPGMMVSVRVKAAQRQKRHGDRRQGYGSPQYSRVTGGIRSMGCSWLNATTSAPHRPLVSPQGRSLGPCLPVGRNKVWPDFGQWCHPSLLFKCNGTHFFLRLRTEVWPGQEPLQWGNLQGLSNAKGTLTQQRLVTWHGKGSLFQTSEGHGHL